MHLPYTLNENLESQELPSNRAGYKATAKAELSITDALLTNLKNQGIYNNSLIFIVGDHGSHTGDSWVLILPQIKTWNLLQHGIRKGYWKRNTADASEAGQFYRNSFDF